VAFLELQIIAEDDGADVVFFEVEAETRDHVAGFGSRDFEHLTRHRLVQAIDASDSVLYFEDSANLFDVQFLEVSRFDLAKQNVLDLAWAERGLGCHMTRKRLSGESRYGSL